MRAATVASLCVVAAIFAFAVCGATAASQEKNRAVLASYNRRRRNPAARGEPMPDTCRKGQRLAKGAANSGHHLLGATCANGESCYGNETCCNGGKSCCPAGMACCGDTCCNNGTSYKSESCCPDPVNGGICCLKENTFCCPPVQATGSASHCCPRWYVCCDAGRFGCCDPDSGLPMEEHEKRVFATRVSDRGHEAKSAPTASTPAPVARAIFAENGIWTDEQALYGNDVNLITAAMTKRVELERGVFHTEQESTRIFAYDPAGDVFYLPQMNFTDPSIAHPITLYSFNSVTGNVTKRPVTGGVKDEVTGFYWSREQSTLLMATKWTTNGDALQGYKYYTVDVATGAATLVSAFENPAAVDTFAGWFHEASADLKFVYRLGYQDVVASSGFGLGIIDISAPTATMVDWVAVPNPSGNYGRLRSVHRINAGSSPGAAASSAGYNVTFVSLAQAENVTDILDLGVFKWSPVPSPAAPPVSQLTQLGNCHITEYFGPIAQATDSTRTKYATMCVALSPLGSTENSWSLATVDTLTGAANLTPLSPTFLSSIDTLSGFGVPDQQ